jgi:diaminopimelate decarboxylase
MLHDAGIGAEVISPYELWLARRLGVAPSKIVYNGPGKSDDSLRDAVSLGIDLINCNHREEIGRVAEAARSVGRRARIGIRVTTSIGWSAQQFGVPIEGGAALAAYREALASPNLDVVGLHVHRGGMIHSEEELDPFVAEVLAFADTLRDRLGLHLERLDLGGSLGSRTVYGLSSRDLRMSQTFGRIVPPPAPEKALSIERYVERLTELVRAHYRTVGKPAPTLLLEPGRAMTSNAQLLLASVLTIKVDRTRTFAILDAGINVAESVRAEYHELIPVSCHGRPADTTYRVVGPICSPGDTLYCTVRLPTLRPGDTLAIMDSGAYFVPFATSFSFPQPPIVMVEGGDARCIRRGERFEDLIARDVQGTGS